MPKRETTSDIVLDTLIKFETPLNLYNLAKNSGLSHQRIRYVLPRLLRDGLILKIENGGNVSYIIQEIHSNLELIQSVLSLIEPMIEEIYNLLDLSQVKDEDQENVLAKNLELFISRNVVM